MEVGEYVRTKQGYIAKIIDKDKRFYWFNSIILKQGGYMQYGMEVENVKEYIVDHNKDVTELLKEGDILRYRINNLSSIKIGEVRKYKDARSFEEFLGVEGFGLNQIEILKIATKEQFKLIEYEV